MREASPSEPVTRPGRAVGALPSWGQPSEQLASIAPGARTACERTEPRCTRFPAPSTRTSSRDREGSRSGLFLVITAGEVSAHAEHGQGDTGTRGDADLAPVRPPQEPDD